MSIEGGNPPIENLFDELGGFSDPALRKDYLARHPELLNAAAVD